MKHFRKPVRFDQIDLEQRSASGRFGRLLYLCFLVFFVGTVAYYFIGEMFVLSANGLVLSDRQVVAARYPGTVTEVLVHEGDNVEEGMPLARLESFDTVKAIADLSLRSSELAVREGELRAKAASVDKLMPLAQRMARQTAEAVTELSKATEKGLVPLRVRGEAVTSSFDAAQRAADLSAQVDLVQAELKVVAESQAVARDAVDKLKAIYDDGVVRALGPGIVGPNIAAIGQVVSRGDKLLEILGGRRFVLAYLPESYLFPVKAGMKVSLKAGNRYGVGTVEKVMQIAGALPEDFQNTMRPRDRSRLARISFDVDPHFALLQKVKVSGCAFGKCWVK